MDEKKMLLSRIVMDCAKCTKDKEVKLYRTILLSTFYTVYGENNDKKYKEKDSVEISKFLI